MTESKSIKLQSNRPRISIVSHFRKNNQRRLHSLSEDKQADLTKSTQLFERNFMYDEFSNISGRHHNDFKN